MDAEIAIQVSAGFALDGHLMHSQSTSQPCYICGRHTPLWCSRCQNAWYCGPEHSHSDWSRHREECQPVEEVSVRTVAYSGVNMIATPPPAEPQFITVSAILFSPEEERPKIINVNCRPSPKASQGMCPVPVLDAYFDKGLDKRLCSFVLTQGLNGEPLRFPLQVFYDEAALRTGTPENRAIKHITSSSNTHKVWAGPVIVLKFNGSRRQGYSEAGSNDLPALSAYFLSQSSGERGRDRL